MTNLQTIAKALSNPVRIDILEYLLERRVANKSELLARTKLKRAALDHHLRPLLTAGLIGIVDVTIDKVRNSLCFPASSITLTRNPEMSSDGIGVLLGTEVESDVDHSEIEEKAQRAIRNGEIRRGDAKAILRTLFEHRGRGTKNTCASCGRIKKMTYLTLCDNCLRPACNDCVENVQRTEGETHTICDRCVREMFGS
ncbi:MAG: ArsR family transcriptional regulator [Candidatus Thorarchaeota archaeon]